MFDGRWREGMERGLRPVGANLGRTGISADQLTALGLTLSLATAVCIATGHLFWGLVLLGAASLPDMLDGAVAKASGTASPRGAFFDSVADRMSDSLVLGGIGWFLASTRGGLAPLLPFAVMGASSLISYERARAESLGFVARGGLMERAERIVVVAIGLAFSAVLVPVLWVMLALTMFTAGQRFAMVWRQAAPMRPEARPVTIRWRTWKERATTPRRGPRAHWPRAERRPGPVPRSATARFRERRARTRP